jgi:hypothetical protein
MFLLSLSGINFCFITDSKLDLTIRIMFEYKLSISESYKKGLKI